MAFSLRRGLKEVFAAKVIKDDATGYVTGTPFHLIPVGTMTRTVNSDTASTFFDDTLFASTTYEGATDVVIEGASIDNVGLANLFPQMTVDAETGAIFDSGDPQECYYAIGGTAETIDGVIERFWMYKCTIAPVEKSDKTKDDTTDTNGMTLNIAAYRTTYEFPNVGRLKNVAIESSSTVLKSGQSWTAQVVTPENKGTILEPASSTAYDLSAVIFGDTSYVNSISISRGETTVTPGTGVLNYGDKLSISTIHSDGVIPTIYVNGTMYTDLETVEYVVTGNVVIAAGVE